jgi:hypothetical protein
LARFVSPARRRRAAARARDVALPEVPPTRRRRRRGVLDGAGGAEAERQPFEDRSEDLDAVVAGAPGDLRLAIGSSVGEAVAVFVAAGHAASLAAVDPAEPDAPDLAVVVLARRAVADLFARLAFQREFPLLAGAHHPVPVVTRPSEILSVAGIERHADVEPVLVVDAHDELRAPPLLGRCGRPRLLLALPVAVVPASVFGRDALLVRPFAELVAFGEAVAVGRALLVAGLLDDFPGGSFRLVAPCLLAPRLAVDDVGPHRLGVGPGSVETLVPAVAAGVVEALGVARRARPGARQHHPVAHVDVVLGRVVLADVALLERGVEAFQPVVLDGTRIFDREEDEAVAAGRHRVAEPRVAVAPVGPADEGGPVVFLLQRDLELEVVAEMAVDAAVGGVGLDLLEQLGARIVGEVPEPTPTELDHRLAVGEIDLRLVAVDICEPVRKLELEHEIVEMHRAFLRAGDAAGQQKHEHRAEHPDHCPPPHHTFPNGMGP